MSALPKSESFQHREEWEALFQYLLELFSRPPFEQELLRAKGIFFEKLGRSHEMREEYFDSVSQSFLEWYIFDYQMLSRRKSPAVTFVVNDWGSARQRELLRQALVHHASVFEVKSFDDHFVELEDLVVPVRRRLFYDRERVGFRLWKVEAQQIIQARIFWSEELQAYFATHLWLHGDLERELVRKALLPFQKKWGLHREVLRHLLECLIRSLSLREQMAAVSNRNWIYQDWIKRYAASS